MSDRALFRTAVVADRVVTISVEAMRRADGSPIYAVHWEPSQPTRLTGTDCQAFDAFRRTAIRELGEQLASMGHST